MTIRVYERNSHHLNTELKKTGKMPKMTDHGSRTGQISHAVGQKKKKYIYIKCQTRFVEVLCVYILLFRM